MTTYKPVTCNGSKLGVISGVVWDIIFAIIFACVSHWLWGAGNDEELAYLISVICGLMAFGFLWDAIIQTKFDIMANYEVDPFTGRITVNTFGFPHSQNQRVIKYDRILKVNGGRRMFLNAGHATVRYVTFLNTKPETNDVTFSFLTDPVSTIDELKQLIEKDPVMEMEVTTVQK